mmetsp:Transcript_79523/g.215059  ORF Transcript_79523/g.215059 Transcript_79523/m.215059 type:complete len:336 (+) Transcript_79523:248-1255(+)
MSGWARCGQERNSPNALATWQRLLGDGALQNQRVHVDVEDLALHVAPVDFGLDFVQVLEEHFPSALVLLAEIRLHAIEQVGVVLLQERLVRRGEDVDDGHDDVLPRPSELLAILPAHGGELRVRVVVSNEAHMSVPTCDDEEVGDEAICHHPLGIPSVATFNLGGQPFVGLWGECVMGLPRLLENDCPHPLHVQGVRAIRTAHRSLPAHCEDAVHQFPECTDQQPPVREKRSLLQLRVQLFPLLVHHQGLDGREVSDVGDDAAVAAGDHTGQLGEFLERCGTVQQVVGACQRVHGLKVHEDGAEGEDRGQPPDRELGVEGLAYGPRQQIGCPEVR